LVLISLGFVWELHYQITISWWLRPVESSLDGEAVAHYM